MKKYDIIKIPNEYMTESKIEGVSFPVNVIEEGNISHIAERLSNEWVSVETDYSQISREVEKEVIRAKSMFPANFVNQHEGYAVLLEEVDELWDEIKKNQKLYDLAAQKKEAIQACAMLFRFIHELLPELPKTK